MTPWYAPLMFWALFIWWIWVDAREKEKHS